MPQTNTAITSANLLQERVDGESLMALLSREASHCVGVCHIAEAGSKAAGHSCGRPPLLSNTPAVACSWHLSGALAPKNARCLALAHSHTIAAARNKSLVSLLELCFVRGLLRLSVL